VAPLPLGYTGEREILEILLSEPLQPEEVRERLNAAVPRGIAIREVIEVPSEGKSAASKLLSASYTVELPRPVEDLGQRLAALLEEPSIEIDEERDRTIRRRNIRPLILTLEAESSSVFSLTAAYEGGTVRPEQILDLLGIPRDGARITRGEITVGH
jgi:radical SAM-linked protein